MFCRKCGQEIAENSMFCRYCGVKVESVETQETRASKRLTIKEVYGKAQLRVEAWIKVFSKFIRKNKKGLLLASAILAPLILLMGLGYAYKSSVDTDRSKAQAAIKRAETAISRASLAAEPKTQEETEVKDAQQFLSKAKTAYKEASFFNRKKYEDAEAKARKAYKIALIILNRVSALLEEAKQLEINREYDKALSACFALYKRYPRTEEAKEALERSEWLLSLKIEGMGALDTLRAIADFNKAYPKADKPPKIIDKTKRRLLEIASNHLSSQKEVLNFGQKWVAEMRSKGNTTAPLLLGSLSVTSVSELEQVLALIPVLAQPPEMHRLFSLLIESGRFAEHVASIGDSPVAVDETTRYYSIDQINQVNSICGEMAPRLAEAENLLNTLRG